MTSNSNDTSFGKSKVEGEVVCSRPTSVYLTNNNKNKEENIVIMKR